AGLTPFFTFFMPFFMKINVNDIESILTELLLARLDIDLIRKMASVDVQGTSDNGTNFSVQPFNDSLASFTLNYENGVPFINLEVGEHTALEIPLEGQEFTEKSGLEELFSI